jgi:hypothetical protein
MAYTYSKIATYTVGSGGVSSIDLFNIPQNYTDLIISASMRTNRNERNDAISLQFNGSTGSLCSHKLLYGNTFTSSSQSITSSVKLEYACTASAATATGSVFGSAYIYIPGYSENYIKSISTETVSEHNSAASAGDGVQYLNAGTWGSGSPINSISIAPQFGTTIVQYSTVTIYGIKAEV